MQESNGKKQRSGSELHLPAAYPGAMSGEPAHALRPPAGRYPDLFVYPQGQGYDTGAPAQVSLGALWRWKWTIGIVFVLAATAMLAAIWTMVKLEYSSTAVVRVAAMVPRIAYKTEETGTVPQYSSYLNTQASILQSPEVLNRVLDREDVQKTTWYQQTMAKAAGDRAYAAERMGRRIYVKQRRGTELIDVTFSWTVPEDTAVLVNAIADEYKGYWREQQTANHDDRLKKLHTQLAADERELDALFQKRRDLSRQLGPQVHTEARSQMVTQLYTMEADLAKLKLEQAVREFEITELQGQSVPIAGSSAKDVPIVVDSSAAPASFQDDEMWIKHREELEEAMQRLVQARQSFDPETNVDEAMAEVKMAKRMLKLTEKRLADAHYTFPYRLQSQRKARLESAIAELKEKITEGEQLATELAKAEEQYTEEKELRDQLRLRVRELEVEGTGPRRVSIQTYGQTPLRPARDRRDLFSAIALVLAMGMGLGVSYVRMRFDSTIRNPSDLGACGPGVTGYLGQLPHTRDVLHVATGASVMGLAINENMRMVRTMLIQRLGATQGSVVVTSPNSNVGKTTVSILLARSFVQMGAKVLLVDGDLARQSVSRHFGVKNTAGLLAVLNGLCSDRGAIISAGGRGVDVLPVGRRAAVENHELLANGSFKSALDRWREEYDFVVIDSPPLLSMADASIAACHADGAIMILRASTSRRAEALEAYNRLAAAGGTLLGTVLVGVDFGSAPSPYDYYRDRKYAHPTDTLV